MARNRITLRVSAHNFAAGPPFAVANGWRPRVVTIYATRPDGADVIATAIPAQGGMRVVVYNRGDASAEVEVDSEV